ncbi:MAG TPA: hypothetical protein VF796_11660 [Humisphaera sp.]
MPRLAAVAVLAALTYASAAFAAPPPAAAPAAPAGKTPAGLQGGHVTFNKDVAPILFDKCASCHRPGEVAPFSLLTYADAKRRSTQLAEVTGSRFMPPWLPAAGHGEFAGERRLNDSQIATIKAWADAGAPEGDPKDLPPQPKFVDGWALGEPDMVVKMPEKYTLRAEGRDVFRIFTIPLELTEDKYVTAVDFRPGNRKIVHHALFFLDASGQARKLDEADKEPGYSSAGLGFVPAGGLGGWAPGVTAHHLPDGVARILRKGTDLVVQVHFHPSGKVETEQSTIGLYFAKKVPQKLTLSLPKPLNRRQLDIPPGEKNFVMTDTFVLPFEVSVIGVFPHAHLLCKEIKIDATLPDGKVVPVIWIKNWDWNWQDEFLFKQEMRFPANTRVDQKYVFDNSADNERNPNSPPKRVTWGEQTADEMAISFFMITAPKDAAIFQFGLGGNRFGRRGGAAAQPQQPAPAEPKK